MFARVCYKSNQRGADKITKELFARTMFHGRLLRDDMTHSEAMMISHCRYLAR